MLQGKRGAWLVSPGFDLCWIVGPPAAAALLPAAFPALRAPETPIWAWALLVCGVDVAHVYASLYRTYLDPDEFPRRRSLYLNVPAACLGAGIVLHSLGAGLFWRALAYLAVFHFVRQQYGLLRIYRRLHGERGRLAELIDGAAVHAAMLYPLAFWHAAPQRSFAWFVPGDFVRLPEALARATGWFYALALAAFAAMQLGAALAGRPANWGKIGVVASTAAAWYVGIVAFDSDFAFALTNILAHGVPYLALIWLYGRRRWAAQVAGVPSARGKLLEALHRPRAVLLFLAPLLALAYLEEGLWDLLVWKEHAAVFGGLSLGWDVPAPLLNVLVPLLALPQAAHYVLDAWIWRFDGSNPGLEERLLGTARETRARFTTIGR